VEVTPVVVCVPVTKPVGPLKTVLVAELVVGGASARRAIHFLPAASSRHEGSTETEL
jgi:hypothetical protein